MGQHSALINLLAALLFLAGCSASPNWMPTSLPSPSASHPATPTRTPPTPLPSPTRPDPFSGEEQPTPTPNPSVCPFWDLPQGSPLTPTPAVTVSSLAASRFVGLRVPPFPVGVEVQYRAGLPYGEGNFPGPFYGVFLVREGPAQMLWIGLQFAEGGYRITDAVPFPALQEDEILTPFFCSRAHEYDIYLIAVARCSSVPLTNIVRAWRINPDTESLDEVSTKAIECSP